MDKYVLAISLLILDCLAVFGKESVRTDFRIAFQTGSIDIDPAMGDNAESLAGIEHLLESIAADDDVELLGVTFSGAASPDGRAAFNKSLAKARMSALEGYVRGRVSLPDSIVRRESGGIAWDLLTELVDASDMPHKEEALHILRNVPEAVYDSRGRLVDSRKKQLMDLRGGRTWHYMDEHFFAQLRNACTVIVESGERRVEREAPTKPAQLDSLAQSDSLGPATAPAQLEAPALTKPFYMALKSNMLYDVLLLPNVGAEFYLGKGWSISANWMYGWWDCDNRHRYWRAYGGDIALRKWFGAAADRKPLTGHHLGLYGQLLTYDFEFGGEGQIAGKPGEPLWSEPSYAAGIEYGYSLPIGTHLNIDFAVGIGYLGGTYYKYKPIDGHYVWQGTSRRHWFGPTKAEISLVWLLGRGNVNAKKGGAE